MSILLWWLCKDSEIRRSVHIFDEWYYSENEEADNYSLFLSLWKNTLQKKLKMWAVNLGSQSKLSGIQSINMEAWGSWSHPACPESRERERRRGRGRDMSGLSSLFPWFSVCEPALEGRHHSQVCLVCSVKYSVLRDIHRGSWEILNPVKLIQWTITTIYHKIWRVSVWPFEKSVFWKLRVFTEGRSWELHSTVHCYVDCWWCGWPCALVKIMILQCRCHKQSVAAHCRSACQLLLTLSYLCMLMEEKPGDSCLHYIQSSWFSWLSHTKETFNWIFSYLLKEYTQLLDMLNAT